jgi:hypothetical protein
MPVPPLPSRSSNKAAALIIVLAFVVLMAGLALAYFSRATTDRQLAHSSYNDTSADLLARSVLDVVVGDFQQEIVNGSTATSINGTTIYIPTAAANVVPQRNSPTLIPNLIRISVSGDPGIAAPAVGSRASAVKSTNNTSANGRFISTTRWNKHCLIPAANPSTATVDNPAPTPSFTPPDWVIVTRAGPTPFASWNATLADPSVTNTNYAIGRYAYAVYDEGGLLDMNTVGWPVPATPMPQLPTEFTRKGVPAMDDATALGATPVAVASPTASPTATPTASPSPSATGTPSPINQIVAFRNWATAQAAATPSVTPPIWGTFGGFSFTVAATSNFLDYVLGSPVGTPGPSGGQPRVGLSPGKGFITVNPISYGSPIPGSTPPRTDQAFTTRAELINFLKSTVSQVNPLQYLQYMGTFSREQNKPTLPLTPAWPFTRVVLPQRFYLGNLNLVQAPTGTATPTATATPTGTPTANAIVTSLGLQFASVNRLPTPTPTITPTPIPTPTPTPTPQACENQVRWKYVGNQNLSNTTPLLAIPAFPGDLTTLDFFQYINYALFGRTDSDSTDIPYTLGIGAALIDNYDADSSVTNAYGLITGIYYGSAAAPCAVDGIPACLVYGMEQAGSSMWYVNPTTGCGISAPPPTPQPLAAQTPPINSPVRSVGEFGWGYSILNAANGRNIPASGPRYLIDFKDAYDSTNNPDPALLDFFTYNSAPVRAGIVSLNTRQAPVLAAILKSAFWQEPYTSFTLSLNQATTAGNAIVNATNPSAGGVPAMSRADIARFGGAVAQGVFGVSASQDTRDTFARVLSELTQTRTWGLLIDVVAQTGHYKPNATNLQTDFVVEGEKRYWLHVAIDRFDGTIVDQQLEEVTE